jgi:hypothetical protein
VTAGNVLPSGVARSFHLAASELGMCSAAWLFIETLGRHGGQAAVAALNAQLGDTYPVLGQVTDMALDGRAFEPPDPTPLLDVLGDATTVLVVGLEARWLDVLVPRLRPRRVVLLAEGLPQTDWQRVGANLGDAVELAELGSFQRHAGARSALLTFVYGVTAHRVHVVPSWLRVMGADTSTQFRTIVGWDVLREPMDRYPRFLADSSPEDFMAVV